MKIVSKSPSNTTSRAFTLIELLTVIAIIGILAAILIPVVGSVRESAKVGACAAQLRDLGLAVHLYAEDHNDRTPPNVHLGQPWTVDGNLGGRVISLLLHVDKGGVHSASSPWGGDYLDDAKPLFCPYSREELFSHSGYVRPENVTSTNKVGRSGYMWYYFTNNPDNAQNNRRLNDTINIDNPNRPFMWDFPAPGTAGLAAHFTVNPHEKRANVWHVGGHVTSADLDDLRENATSTVQMYDFFTSGSWTWRP